MTTLPLRAELPASPFSTTRRRHRRRWPWILLALASVGSVVAMSIPIIQGKTSVPEYGLRVAAEGIEEARRERADRWTPELLASAEAALQTGRLEVRLQQIRFLPFRDFTDARLHLDRAVSESRGATQQSMHAREEARNQALTHLADADRVIGTADEVARAASISAYDRGLIQRAKTAQHEARIYFEEADYVAAREAASGAQATVLRVITRAEKEIARYGDRELVARWRGWIDETIAWSRRNSATAIIVNKEKHQLFVYSNGALSRTYAAELGYNSVRDKRYSGDAATPEGKYRITSKKGLGQSTYHRAFLLDYPNEEDRREFAQLRRAGQVPKSAGVGGLIEIHGEGGRGKDWTKGCVALSNAEMDELARRVEVGTPVTIVGGDGSGGFFTNLMRETEAMRSASKPSSN